MSLRRRHFRFWLFMLAWGAALVLYYVAHL